MKKELENAKKDVSTHIANTLHDLKKQLDNARKKEESTTKTIQDLKKELEDERKRETN